MCYKFIQRFVVFCLLLILLVPIWGEKKVLNLGGKNSWPTPWIEGNTTQESGFGGKNTIQLSTKPLFIPGDKNVDFAISFDKEGMIEETQNYTITKHGGEQIGSLEGITGKSAGKFSRGRGGLSLTGTPGCFFGTPGLKGSFTLSFWLYSAVAEDGEQIFSWKTSRKSRNKMVSQFIRGAIFNNRIEWTFNNFFVPPSGSETNFVLTAQDMLIPDTWNFHTITFNEFTGLLEYRINGKTQGILYTTSTGHEGGQIFIPETGYNAPLEICHAFSGLIDEIIFKTEFTETDITGKFNENGGIYYSQPIDLGSKSSKILDIKTEAYIPQGTDYQVFVRTGNNFYQWTENSPEWHTVNENTNYNDLKGRYAQIRIYLFTNGEADLSPEITGMQITWEEESSPWPPSTLYAEAGDGEVTLEWSSSPNLTTQGYLVYYGKKTGEYFGTEGDSGPSPINAGNVNSITISGLKNGTLYYFAVSAYNDEDDMYSGTLSKEVNARPKRK